VKGYIILITLACIVKISIGQTSSLVKATKYLVDKNVGERVKKFEYNKNGVLKRSMDINVSWGKGQFFGRNPSPIDCFTKSFITNDTICITGHMGGNLGWGFKLYIIKDSCIVNAFALSDGDMYKYYVSDKKPRSLIILSCIKQQLTLSKRPEFRKGEVVSGYIELASQPFYYYMEKENTRSDIKLRAYFQTESLKETPAF
jgi:hypothetical protein